MYVLDLVNISVAENFPDYYFIVVTKVLAFEKPVLKSIYTMGLNRLDFTMSITIHSICTYLQSSVCT